MPHASRPSYRRALTSYTEKNKPRLYIAIYPRGGNGSSVTSGAFCDSYHWALTIGPPTALRGDPGTRYHLAHSSTSSPSSFTSRDPIHSFFFEEDDLLETPAAQKALLCRIAVAKVIDDKLARKVLRSISVSGENAGQYSCYSWVKDAFIALHRAGCLKSYFDERDWRDVEKTTREYCKNKRHSGRFVEGAEGPWDVDEVCTYSAWQYRETTA